MMWKNESGELQGTPRSALLILSLCYDFGYLFLADWAQLRQRIPPLEGVQDTEDGYPNNRTSANTNSGKVHGADELFSYPYRKSFQSSRFQSPRLGAPPSSQAAFVDSHRVIDYT